MSAIGGKADMTVCRSALSRSQLELKRTWAVAVYMSAFRPKRRLDLIKVGPEANPPRAAPRVNFLCEKGTAHDTRCEIYEMGPRAFYFRCVSRLRYHRPLL